MSCPLVRPIGGRSGVSGVDHKENCFNNRTMNWQEYLRLATGISQASEFQAKADSQVYVDGMDCLSVL